MGAIIASRTPEIALLIAFCALNIVNIYLLGKRSRLADTTDATDVRNVATKVATVGGSGGLLAGLFGVGGGLVMVPCRSNGSRHRFRRQRGSRWQ